MKSLPKQSMTIMSSTGYPSSNFNGHFSLLDETKEVSINLQEIPINHIEKAQFGALSRIRWYAIILLLQK